MMKWIFSKMDIGHKAPWRVGDKVLVCSIEEGDRGSGNGDGGHPLLFLVRSLLIIVGGGVLFMR
jgi:hypothetical protein